MKFSVIVPVYNISEYLEECIKSVVNQNYTDYELILVDDGSTDESPLICDKYQKAYSNIRVIHKKNGGLTSARKAGAKIAKGDYIVCLDGDDYWKDNYFNTIDKLINNQDIICFGYLDQKEKKYLNNVKPGMYTGVELFENFMIDLKKDIPNYGSLIYSIWTKVIKRELYVEEQMKIPNDIVMGEDLLLSAMLLKKATKVLVSNYCGYIYRTNMKSITRMFSTKRVIQYTRLCEELLKVFSDEKNKVYCFAKMSLFNTYSEMILSSKSYMEFKNYLKEVEYCDSLKVYSNKAIIEKGNLNTKLKNLLDENGWYHVMYFILIMKYKFIKNR